MQPGITDELYWNLLTARAVVRLGLERGLAMRLYEPPVRSIADGNDPRTNWSVGRAHAAAGGYAVEIHYDAYGRDGIGSGLTKLGWLAGDLKAGSGMLQSQSNELCAGIHELARELDAAVWAVSPKHDTLTSLLAYLCEFAADHFNRTPIRCRVSTPDSLPSGPVPPHVRNHLFMATREALNNALKHSNANEVQLNISYQNDILEIEVADTGQGFDPEQVKRVTGHGLQNIKDRMREIQGRAEITSDPQGTRVRLIIPLAKQAVTA
jgi:two-component sensor histidine kinase